MSASTSQDAAAPLWRPSPERVAQANLTRFMAQVNKATGTTLAEYEALWRWSVDNPERFWTELWSFAGVVAETQGKTVLADPTKMPGAKFFPEARLNFARNLLRRNDATPALIFRGEDKVKRTLSWAELNESVSRVAQALKAAGVGMGDRVAGIMPNMPESIIALLAASSIGAVWSSCSPDFGVQGVIDRFGQIEPKVLFAVDGYFYNGKTHDCLAKLREIAPRLPTLRKIVIVPYAAAKPALDGLPIAALLPDFVAPFKPGPIEFASLPFNHPLVILFSSGTTGVPKCIVHGAGGTLLQHLKELLLHCDVKPGDRMFYFTTCSWMMWNWLVSGLAVGATLCLYDGSPFYPSGNVLYDFADEAGFTLFGTSAKYIDACAKAGIEPARTHKLTTVRAITSTGSPLVAESFDYVYSKIKKDVHLASISGGTDIVSCFVLGNPIGPVWRGEIQARGLGLAVEVFDDTGKPRARRQGRAGVRQALPVHAGRVLERSRRQEISRRLFRALPQCLDARRLDGDHAAQRRHHLRPLGCRAQSRRRAHRHGGDLSPGRADRGSAGEHRHRPGLGQRRARRAVRAPARGRHADAGSREAHQGSDPPQHHAAPRAGQDHPGHRHPAHQERQDRRARRARHRPRPRHQKPRGAGEPGSAGAL